MAIRPIKSLSKTGDPIISKLFKTSRELNLSNIFGNLLVASMETLITFCKGQGLQEFFYFVLNLIPQAHNEDFQLNYREVFEDLEELFEKPQTKIINALIYDSTFISFLVNIQEMFEIQDSKSSENEQLQIIKFYANEMRISIMVIRAKERVKFCVKEPFVHLILHEEEGKFSILYPYEYKSFNDTNSENDLAVTRNEDMRKNSVHPPGKKEASSPRNLGSPTLGSRSKTSGVSSPYLEDSEKRMADRAKIFKLQRKITLEKNSNADKSPGSSIVSPGLGSVDSLNYMTRNYSSEYFLQSRNRDSVLENSNFLSYTGEVTLDSKERTKWARETNLLKEEIKRREELKKFEELILTEEGKINEKRRQEIDKMIEEKRQEVETRRKNEEKRLEEHRKIGRATRTRAIKKSIDESKNKSIDESILTKEKLEAEKKIREAQLKLQEAARRFEDFKAAEELRLISEQERAEEENRLAEENRKAAEKEIQEKIKAEKQAAEYLEIQKKLAEQQIREQERLKEEQKVEQEKARENLRLEQEKLRLEAEKREKEETKRAEDELKRKLEQDRKNLEERNRLEKERLRNEELEKKRKEQEQKLKEEQDRKAQEELQKIENEKARLEEERLQAELKIEEEKQLKEKLRIQRLQEEKKKRAQQEEEYLKSLKDKEAEQKKKVEEKRAQTGRRAEDRKRQSELGVIEEEVDETEKKEQELKKKREEDARLAEQKRKEEQRLKEELEKSQQEQVEEGGSFCGGLYCVKCMRDLKRSNYFLKCDGCNEKYMRTGNFSVTSSPQIPKSTSCMNCGNKLTRGEEVQCIRCFLACKIFGQDAKPCSGCVRTDKCYWVDVGDGNERDMRTCGFCGEMKTKDAVILACPPCQDLVCLVCLRKNPSVTQGVCSYCGGKRQLRIS